MTALDDLTAQLVELRRARSSAALSVRFRNGNTEQEIRYKSDAEMASAIAALENQIASASGSRPVRSVIVRNSSGW